MSNKTKILFVLENDYYPRDMRVFNECSSLAQFFSCYVVAPKHKGQKFVERISSVTCYRFPHFEASSVKFIPFEYLIAAFWIAWLVPFITLTRKIKVIHVANPPDFIILILSWLKIFGKKFIFDAHDLSVETFKGKSVSRSSFGRLLIPILQALELSSVNLANLIIASNASIKSYLKHKNKSKPVYIVRNSNDVLFKNIAQINKSKNKELITIGYFGVLGDDDAAGLDNFFLVADTLIKEKIKFCFSVVGDGPGLSNLERKVNQNEMSEKFHFHGYVDFPDAFDLIKNFDFGLVTLSDLPKNHMHTAMKVMDYMCCAVPVCSLRLKEQVISTCGIGIHCDTFEEIANQIIKIYKTTNQYESLREKTLDHFNSTLSWGHQRQNLLKAYRSLFE